MVSALIQLSDRAAAALKEKMQVSASRSKPKTLLFGVKKSGCAGLSYTLDWADEVENEQNVMLIKGVRVLIDEYSRDKVAGTVIDFQRFNEFDARFVFQNPLSQSECGCGESFSLESSS